jgi:pilus assembly protein CpaE
VHPFTVGVVVRSATLRAGVDAVFQKLRTRVLVDQSQIDDLDLFVRDLRSRRLDVLLLECGDLTVPLDSLVTKLKANSIYPLLVALSESARPELILHVMRAGFHEFLFPPFQDGLQRTIVDRVASTRALGSGKNGRVAAVFSATGGCGATTIACHLAREIARQSSSDVLLADFDLYSGMVQFMMKTKSSYTLADAFDNLHRLDASYWRALVSNRIPRLEVITAPDPTTTSVFPPPDQVLKVLEFLRQQYDWTILDLGREPDYSTMRILNDIDQTLLVTTLDPSSLHRAREILQKLDTLGLNSLRVRLIVRDSPSCHRNSNQEVESSLGWPVFCWLRNESDALADACSQGRLLAASSRQNQQFAGLARKLAGIREQEPASFFGMFRKG